MAHPDAFCDCGVNRMNMLHSACSGRRVDGASFLLYGPAQLDRRSVRLFHVAAQLQKSVNLALVIADQHFAGSRS